MTTVTGVSGSEKSSLFSQALIVLVSEQLGQYVAADDEVANALENDAVKTVSGKIVSGLEGIKRLVQVDQKPIGRTPRSNLATYTGLFDQVRKLFAATKIGSQTWLPENTLGPSIPTCDDPIQRFGNDNVLGRFYNRG